jgi:hypothetical protein
MSRPMAGRTGMTQYPGPYFSLSRADSITPPHPVLIFIDVVGTILVPKANEFSMEFRSNFTWFALLFRGVLSRPPAGDLAAAIGGPPGLAGELSFPRMDGLGCRENRQTGRPVNESLGISATARSGFSLKIGPIA